LWDFNIHTDRVIEARKPDYQDLALELTRLWKTSTKVIPIVIGALRASHKTVDWMALLEVAENKYPLIQQTALLGSAHILRKVLSIPIVKLIVNVILILIVITILIVIRIHNHYHIKIIISIMVF